MTTTPTATADLNILIRIEKLLAQSEDRSCTDPEREAFQAKAFELMERHRIDRSQVGGHLAADDVITEQTIGDFNGIYGRVRIDVVHSVARAMDVNIFWSGYKNYRSLKAYGFKSDIDRLIPLANRLLADADLRVKAIGQGWSMKDTIRERRSFYLGYGDAISTRLRQARKAAEATAVAEGVDLTSTALVLVDRKRQVSEAMASKRLRSAGGINGTSGSGHSAGYQAGATADLSSRNSVGNQKALGR